MRPHEPFFIVEDSLNEKFDDVSTLVHDELSKSDYLEHFDLGGIFKSKSKYKGGFKKGKNTKEYNHDYYIHNKDKWKKDGESQEMTIDELKELGLTDEEIASMKLERNSEGLLIVPTSWVQNFLKGGMSLLDNFVSNLKDTLFPGSKPTNDDSDDEEDKPSFLDNILPEKPKKTDGYEDPKTLDDPQRIEEYTMEIEDQSGRNGETVTTNFDYIPWLTGVKIKDKPASVKEDCEAVNPHYGEDAGYGINCAWCTTTYDLRRRGYDVEAPKVTHGMTIAEETQLYKDTTMSDWTTPHNNHELFSQIANEGNGARGRIAVRWNDGTGGHSMAWEVINNTPYIVDCQTNTIYTETQFERIARYIDWYVEPENTHGADFAVASSGCKWLRTDNRELNASGKINEEMDYTIDPNSQQADNWNGDLKDGKIVYEYTPGSNHTIDISHKFVSKPTNDRSDQLWKDITAKLKHGRLKSKKKSYAKRTT